VFDPKKLPVNLEQHLKTEVVNDAHPAELVSVARSDTIRSVLQRMREKKTGSVLVCTDGRLEGIFTERDVLQLLTNDVDLEATIETVMSREPITVLSTDTVGKAISKMSIGGYRRLPVVDDSGCAVSVLKVSGILRYLVEHFPDLVYTLPPEPHHRTKEREGA